VVVLIAAVATVAGCGTTAATRTTAPPDIPTIHARATVTPQWVESSVDYTPPGSSPTSMVCTQPGGTNGPWRDVVATPAQYASFRDGSPCPDGHVLLEATCTGDSQLARVTPDTRQNRVIAGLLCLPIN
jgi:hypothetical protein